jgi:hypothetical protein
VEEYGACRSGDNMDLWGGRFLAVSGGSKADYILILCSFLILILTPWSEKDRERNVESNIPGNCFWLKT